MASGPITSWQIDGETVADFNFGGWNSNPLQCSCLENPRDGRAWWAAIYGVAQSQTRLKRLSSSSSKITADGDYSHEIKTLAPGKKSYDQPREHFKKQRHYFADKDLSIQSYGFSSSHVWMWELDYKESWTLKNWCFRTVVLEKTLESPLDCKEIQPVHPKRNQSWTFIGKAEVEPETPILWPPDAKNWLTGKDHDAGKD